MRINTKQTRVFAIEGTDGDGGNFITASLSSELPYQRDFGMETLLHGKQNVDMSRASRPEGLPLLLNHDDKSLPIGRIKNIRIDEDRKLRGDFYFSGRPEAQAVKQDIIDGILTDTSIGYQIKDYEETPSEIAGRPNNFNVTRWMPYEASLVAVPADATVGIGRNFGVDDSDKDTDGDKMEIPPTPELKEEKSIKELGLVDGLVDIGNDDNLENSAEPADKTDEAGPDEEEDKAIDVDPSEPEESTSGETRPEESENATDVRCDEEKMINGDKETPPVITVEDDGDEDDGVPDPTDVRKMGKSELLNTSEVSALRSVALNLKTRSIEEIDAIISKSTLDEARKLLLTPEAPKSTKQLFISENRKMLDINKLNRAFTDLVKGNSQALEGDNAELKEYVRQTGTKSFEIDVFKDFNRSLNKADLEQMKRDMTTSNASSGINQVAIGYIDYLFARTALLKAGATVKTGVGSLDYIKVASPVTVSAQNEDSTAPGATGMTFTKVPYLPHEMVAVVPVSQELQKESTYDIQTIIRQDVSKAFAVYMDKIGINGSTAWTNPISGVLTSGNYQQYIPSATASSVPAFADVNQLKAIVDQVAVNLDDCSYLCSPQLFGLMETVAKGTSIYVPIADHTPFNNINGYKAFTSANVPNNVATGGQCSLSGTTLTLTTAPTSGSVALGMTITATGVPANAYITGLLSGTWNAVGSTYSMSAALTTESAENFSGVQYGLVFGDFTTTEFCFQSPLQVLVDDITMFSKGVTNLCFRQYIDFGVKQPTAISYNPAYRLV